MMSLLLWFSFSAELSHSCSIVQTLGWGGFCKNATLFWYFKVAKNNESGFDDKNQLFFLLGFDEQLSPIAILHD